MKIHIRFGTLLAATLLSTLMLTTIDVSQNLVFAQNSPISQESPPITPAPETSDSDDDSLSSGDSNDKSSGSSDDSSSEGSDEQDTSTSDDEDETEDDFEQTNPLLEQIRMSVSGALSATGISGPEF